jgi:hypothetical protein
MMEKNEVKTKCLKRSKIMLNFRLVEENIYLVGNISKSKASLLHFLNFRRKPNLPKNKWNTMIHAHWIKGM